MRQPRQSFRVEKAAASRRTGDVVEVPPCSPVRAEVTWVEAATLRTPERPAGVVRLRAVHMERRGGGLACRILREVDTRATADRSQVTCPFCRGKGRG